MEAVWRCRSRRRRSHAHLRFSGVAVAPLQKTSVGSEVMTSSHDERR
jgi:hypothetical protein